MTEGRLKLHEYPSSHGLAVAVGALLWLVLAFSSAMMKSATVDEVPHYGAGLSLIEYGDFRMNPEHPPLIKVLSTLPVWLFYRPNLTVAAEKQYLSSWFDAQQVEFGYYLLYLIGEDPRGHLMLARVVPILIGLLGGVLAWLWGRELTGEKWGGALSAFLLLFYPEYLGHARFLTFDVPTLVGCAWISWAGLKYFKRPGEWTAVHVVVASVVGSQIKLPVVLFAVLLHATLLVVSLMSGRRVGLARTLLLCVATAGAGYVAAWAVGGFRFALVPDPSEIFGIPPHVPGGPPGEGFRALVIDWAWRNKLLPEYYLAAINHVASFQARQVFLMGEGGVVGWYHYFLVTFLLKTPLAMIGATLLLLAGMTRSLAMNRRRFTASYRLQRGLILVLPFVAMFFLTILSRINLGHRYVLFVYFPLCVAMGAWTWRWLREGGVRKLLAVGLLLLQVGSVGTSYPHYATYFHFLVGNPYKGSDYLSDSNVDWGQDMYSLGQFVQEHKLGRINLAVFGHNRPFAYGIREFNWILPSYPYAVMMPDAVDPDPELFTAVSMNNLGAMKVIHGGRFLEPPDLVLNSIAVYSPYADWKPAGE